ncbi:MAG: hypothetical protein ACOH1R_09450, partial [Luteimonas sp.]
AKAAVPSAPAWWPRSSSKQWVKSAMRHPCRLALQYPRRIMVMTASKSAKEWISASRGLRCHCWIGDNLRPQYHA